MNDKPPIKELIPFGVQHSLLIAFQALPYPLLVAAGLGFDPAQTAILVSCAFFVAGISTILQTIGVGPVGGKVPIAMTVSVVFVSPALLIAPQVGYAGYVGACLVGSLICGLVFFAFSDKLRVIFPPFVSGSVVFVLGATLIGVALGYCAGGSGNADFGDPSNFILSGVTLIAVLVFHVLGKGFLHGAAPLLGLCIGFVVAICMGKVDFQPVVDAAWFGFPQPLYWGIEFPLDACLTIGFLAICGVAELLGDVSATTKIAANRMPTKRETRGVIFTQAITSAFSGLFNCGPTISASADVGLLGFTKVCSRYVVAVAGSIMILAGICPKVSALCSVIPTAVFGGAVLLMFGVILVNGIKIIMESKPDERVVTIVAVSTAVGLGFNAFPEALAQFPFWVSMFLCGIPGTAFTAVILNLILPGRKNSTQWEDGIEEEVDLIVSEDEGLVGMETK
ncbi:MAG: purine/pyrimidine permease [Eggerthellaceae bacterium]|nr:purine/pyrimidine permease [Eggerthellaceae bacterium]